MNYAKLINGELINAPSKMPIEIDGEPYTVYNPSAELLKADGWLPVILSEMPEESPAGYHYEPVFSEWQTENGNEILQEWELVENSDDISDAEALEIIMGGAL